MAVAGPSCLVPHLGSTGPSPLGKFVGVREKLVVAAAWWLRSTPAEDGSDEPAFESGHESRGPASISYGRSAPPWLDPATPARIHSSKWTTVVVAAMRGCAPRAHRHHVDGVGYTMVV